MYFRGVCVLPRSISDFFLFRTCFSWLLFIKYLMGFAFSSDYSLKASLPELFEQMEELFAKEEAVAVAVS